MPLSREHKAVIAMLILSIIFGIAGYTARTLQHYFSIWQQLSLQSWLAFFLLLGIECATTTTGPKKPLSRKDLKELFGRAAIGRIASSYFFIQACLFAPLGNVGWISTLPTSAFFGWWLFGQCVSSRDWLLLAVGVLGVGMIAGPELNLTHISGQGEFYALLSVLASGLAAFFGKSVTREHGAILSTKWVLFFTAILATVGAFLVNERLILPPFEAIPMLVLVSVMVASGTACSIYGYAHLRASTATALLSLEAVWAVMLGLLIYGEEPTVSSLAGGALIVVVAYLMAPSPGKKERRCDQSHLSGWSSRLVDAEVRPPAS